MDLPHKMLEKEIAFKRSGITYELHNELIFYGVKKNRAFWREIMDSEWKEWHDVIVNGVSVRTLSPTVNVAYIFIHLFFHFIREGVALRQFCDWTMVLHYYKDEIDRTKLREILQKLDMIKAYQAFGSILVDELGLPKEEFPFELNNNDRKWKDSILSDVFKGGNFGRKNHKAKSSWQYKVETFFLMSRNCIKYYVLAPSELRMMIPKMIGINLRLLLNR